MKPFLPAFVRKAMLTLLCMVFLYCTGFSQHIIFGNDKFKVEAGLNFGPTFFLGDLGGNQGKGTPFLKDINLELTKMMKGAFISVYPADWIGLRVAGQYTFVAGEDNIINTTGIDESWRKQRNLNFRSKMWEAYAAIELYPTLLFNADGTDPRLKPYGFIGGGIFHFNPEGSVKTNYGGKGWYELHPLRTEGQGMAEYPDKKPYSLTQFNVPMGVGIKYQLSERVNIGTELLYRKTFTDYIDDVSTTYIDPYYFDQYLPPADALVARKIHDKTVSIVTNVTRYQPGTQRGNSQNMDAYFSTVLKLGVRMGFIDNENNRARRQTRCPLLY